MSYIIYVILLLLGFPTAYVLTKLCKDEIKNWKVRFIIIILTLLILSIVISFTNFKFKIPVIISLMFMVITLLVVILKSS